VRVAPRTEDDDVTFAPRRTPAAAVAENAKVAAEAMFICSLSLFCFDTLHQKSKGRDGARETETASLSRGGWGVLKKDIAPFYFSCSPPKRHFFPLWATRRGQAFLRGTIHFYAASGVTASPSIVWVRVRQGLPTPRPSPPVSCEGTGGKCRAGHCFSLV
jgi:hypothetical protein